MRRYWEQVLWCGSDSLIFTNKRHLKDKCEPEKKGNVFKKDRQTHKKPGITGSL